MICKPCREQNHSRCDSIRDETCTNILIEPTWCDCQHKPMGHFMTGVQISSAFDYMLSRYGHDATETENEA